MPSTQSVIVRPVSRVVGLVHPPGDQSISHGEVVPAAIAGGASVVDGYSTGGGSPALSFPGGRRAWLTRAYPSAALTLRTRTSHPEFVTVLDALRA